MKKSVLFALAIAVLVGTMSLSSCAKDSGDDNPLVGTWSGYVGLYVVTFKSDKTFSASIFSLPYAGTYTFTDTVVNLTYSGGGTSSYYYTISGKTLTLTDTTDSTDVTTLTKQ
jgi:hypothetical protein